MGERPAYQQIDKQWLLDHGSLHDTLILAWHAQDGITTLRLNDVWWNFEGFPEYKGPKPGSLVISGTQHSPDCARTVSEMILMAELVDSGGITGLRFYTSVQPPIEILGKTIRWYPETSFQDRTQI